MAAGFTTAQASANDYCKKNAFFRKKFFQQKGTFHFLTELILKLGIREKLICTPILKQVIKIGMICKHQQVMKIITGSWLFYLTTYSLQMK
jgi:hypothetical protein